MRQHFPQPPPAALAAWRPDALLDAEGVDEAALLEGPRPATALAALAPPPELQAAVRGPKGIQVGGLICGCHLDVQLVVHTQHDQCLLSDLRLVFKASHQKSSRCISVHVR